MPSKNWNLKLELNQYMNSDKMPCIICDYIESLIKNIDRCSNNLENTSTSKIGEHIPCGIFSVNNLGI